MEHANTPTNPAATMNATTWAALVVLSRIWGGSLLFGRIGVPEIAAASPSFWRG